MSDIKKLDKKDIKAIASGRYSRKEFTPWNIILHWLIPSVAIVLIMGLAPEPYDWFSMLPLIYIAIVCIKYFVGINKYEKEFLKEWGEI